MSSHNPEINDGLTKLKQLRDAFISSGQNEEQRVLFTGITNRFIWLRKFKALNNYSYNIAIDKAVSYAHYYLMQGINPPAILPLMQFSVELRFSDNVLPPYIDPLAEELEIKDFKIRQVDQQILEGFRSGSIKRDDAKTWFSELSSDNTDILN